MADDVNMLTVMNKSYMCASDHDVIGGSATVEHLEDG